MMQLSKSPLQEMLVPDFGHDPRDVSTSIVSIHPESVAAIHHSPLTSPLLAVWIQPYWMVELSTVQPFEHMSSLHQLPF
jgi:hypothetical protein